MVKWVSRHLVNLKETETEQESVAEEDTAAAERVNRTHEGGGAGLMLQGHYICIFL